MKPHLPWYSFFERQGFNGKEPYYYDSAQFDWAAFVEHNWQVIRTELDDLLRENTTMVAYFDKNMVTTAQSWKTIAFFGWGVQFYHNCQKCPKTVALLQQIPGMVSASFNLLEPNSTIRPHHGDTNAIARCHLGLDVPTGLPDCGFRVGTELRAWENGKLMLFCDAHEHTAWNDSSKNRYILLFDVILPNFIKQKRGICSSVLASLFLQSTAQRLGVTVKQFDNLPEFLQYTIFYLAKWSAYFLVPIRNKLFKILQW